MSNTTYLKNAFDAVKTFMTIGGQTVNSKPSIPSEADMLLRLRLNIEENLELTEAILGQSASRLEPSSIEAIHHMREAVSCIDRMIKQCADKPVFGIEPNIKEVLDALIDIEYSEYRDWETDRKSTRLNSSHRSLSRMPSSA